MKKNVEQLFAEKLNCLENLFNLAIEQKALIERKDYDMLQDKDNQKREILLKIDEIDKDIELDVSGNKKKGIIIQNKIKNINSLLDKLIEVEKENANQLADLSLLISGNYIQFYKKNIK